MADAEHVRHASVVGAAGAMGMLLARNLRHGGHHVTGFDLVEPGGREGFDDFIVGDVLHPTRSARDALGASALIIVALPNDPALNAIGLIAALVVKQALIIDTLSVKTPIIESLRRMPLQCEYLSINPMFAPSLGFAAQKVVVVPHRSGPAAEAFIRTMQQWGASVEKRSAEEHDRACAVMQVATHLVLMLLGRAVADSGVDASGLVKIAPPPHLVSLAMLSRILSGAPETYWDIQQANPYAQETRDRIIAALTELNEIVKSGDFDRFSKALETMRQKLQPELEMLKKVSADAIGAASGTRR